MIALYEKTHRYIRWVFVIVKFFVWTYDKGMDADKIFRQNFYMENKKIYFFCNENAL